MTNSTMGILEGLDGLRQIAPRSVLSIGNFDGVHRGHLALIELARQFRAAEGSASRVVLVTFEPHPLTVLRPELAPPRLTPSMLKRSLLAAAGVDDLVILPPTHDVLDLSAEAFWAILRDQVRPAHLIEGDSFTFGKDRAGTIDQLRRWSADSDVRLHEIDSVRVALCDLLTADVNSSLIRWLLANGRVRDAAICLGRSFAMEGMVVKGFERGRTIGVPTANLRCDDQIVPADGVYAGRCAVDGTIHAAAVSIGTMPTFAAQRRQIEAHLIGFDGNLYNRNISVELIDWIRDQRKFPGVDALQRQLARDIAAAAAVALDARFDPSRAVVAIG